MMKLKTSPVDNPCYKCKDRKVGCHATCERYSEFREKLEEFNKRKRREARDNNLYWRT